MGSNNSYTPSDLMVILCPDHARLIAQAGWSKRDVRVYLFERARTEAAATRGRGQVGVRPRWSANLDRYPVANSPEDILVVVAARHGPHSAVVLPWGLNGSVTRPMLLKSGRAAASVEEFRPAG